MPRRRDYLLLALLFAAVAVYGSIVPMRCRPLGLLQAVREFGQLFVRPPAVRSLSDWAANILLFVPIGYFLLGVFAVDRRRGWAFPAIVPAFLIGAALSLIIEFAQLWIPLRTPSTSDLAAQAIGSAAGMVLWLAVGQDVTNWLRSFKFMERPGVLIDTLLKLYVLGLLVWSVLPLDLTISPADMVHKYREGRISLLPYSGAGGSMAVLFGLFRDVVLFIPLGMLAATWMTSARRPVRTLGTSILLGALAVVCLETIQLFLYSRSTAAADLLAGIAGVVLGAWLMQRWRAPAEEHRPPDLHGRPSTTWFWLAMAVFYSLFLLVVFCWPPEPIHDTDILRARLNGFISVPFASLYRGNVLDAMLETPKKLLLFGLLGVMLAMAVVPLGVPRAIRRLLLVIAVAAAAGVSFLIEMLQVFLPPHVPDVSDVILAAAGAAAGVYITVRIVDRRTPA